MQRIVLLLLGMASLVASGVITNHGRMGFNSNTGFGLQTAQGIQGDLNVNTLNKNELLRQKFILEILQQVYMPLQQQHFLELDDRKTVTNENLYMRPLTQEMLLVLDLIRGNQMLGKQTICHINNEQHMRQMVGLYRLFVAARDFDTFKRLAVYARQNINTEMFVNSLVLALGERNDTKMLIVPALHEILPQLFHKNHIIDQVQQLEGGFSSVRPQLIDVIGMGNQNSQLNSRFNTQQGGLFGILNRSQMWMPWRELHKQLAIRKVMGGNVVQQNESQLNKLVVSLPGNGLLSQDLDLKSYVTILIDELIVNQDIIKNGNFAKRGQIGSDFTIGNNNMYSQRGNTFGSNYGMDIDMNVNRRFGGFDNDNDETEIRDIYGNVKRGYSDNILGGGRRFGNQFDLENEQGKTQFGRYNLQEGQRGINTVSANDARLLFVGRRRKNPNTAFNMGRNQYDDDEMISGGRHVSNNKDEYQRSKFFNDNNDDDDTQYINNERWTNQERYINANRRGMMFDNDDDLHRGFNSHAQKQYNDQYTKRGYKGLNNGESIDINLPTTNVNDERLLHINRHKLNNNVDEINRLYNKQGDFDNEDIENRLQSIKQGGNFGHSTFDEESMWQRNNMDINQRFNANDNKYGKDSSSGRRYRRSLIDQDQFLGNEDSITGKLLLHTLQQLVARLNVERIALGQPQLIDDTQTNNGRGLMNLAGRLNINNNVMQNIDAQTANKIENIIQRVDQVLQQKIGQITVMSYNQKINEIGLLLAGQVQDIGLVEILGELFQQGSFAQQQNQQKNQQHEGIVANIIEKEAAQILLAGIVKVIDNKVQQVFQQRKEFISNVRGVTINNVFVDHLQTQLEYADIDLSNLLNNDFDQTQNGINKIVVGRVPRLNHKDFTIQVDVTSDRQQQVVVRNLLVPKVDGQGNVIPFEQRRQNVIVLDIATAELKQGRNTLTLKSNEITITARDTTPFTKIYQHVMKALNGENTMQQDILVGQSNMLPHRLLLPRGRVNGLPMQLITVITPVEQTKNYVNVNGLAAALFDRLPLNYPLHCDITNLDSVFSMSNLNVKEVKIYHDDNIKQQVY